MTGCLGEKIMGELYSIVIVSIIAFFGSSSAAYAINHDTSIFSQAQNYAESNSYKDPTHNFSVQPPLNWIVLSNIPPNVSKNAVVIFSNNYHSKLATLAIFYRYISPNFTNTINKYSDDDILSQISQEMSVKEADSQTIVLKGVVDRYYDGIRVATVSGTQYNDNSTSVSENVIYFLNSGGQYTLVLTTDPDYYDMNSKLFEDSVNSFLVNQTNLVNQQIQIPSWIKNNARWWADGSIGDSDFIKGIQYLISNGIIKVPKTQIGPHQSTGIPSWVKNNAKWWSEGQISDNEFVKGIQYLITNGMILT